MNRKTGFFTQNKTEQSFFVDFSRFFPINGNVFKIDTIESSYIEGTPSVEKVFQKIRNMLIFSSLLAILQWGSHGVQYSSTVHSSIYRENRVKIENRTRL